MSKAAFLPTTPIDISYNSVEHCLYIFLRVRLINMFSFLIFCLVLQCCCFSYFLKGCSLVFELLFQMEALSRRSHFSSNEATVIALLEEIPSENYFLCVDGQISLLVDVLSHEREVFFTVHFKLLGGKGGMFRIYFISIVIVYAVYY